MSPTRPAIARAVRSMGKGRFEVIFVAARRVSVVAIRRRGIVFDARYVPGLREPTDHAMIYLLLEGGVEAGMGTVVRYDAPCALAFDENAFEGVVGHERTAFRNFGEPLVIVELRLPRELVPVARPGAIEIIAVPDEAWSAARRLALLPTDDREVEAAGADLIAALATAGAIVDANVGWSRSEAGAAPETILPADLGAEKVGSLDALAEVAGVSIRSVARGLELLTTMFRSPFTGWRETTRRLRLKVAVMALSTEDLSIREVARVAGFGSVEAMARAFRDAESPAPGTVRQALHGTRERLAQDGAGAPSAGANPMTDES